MCRLFGIISDHECMDRISDKIEQFRTFAKNNPDGWGLGYYENGNAKIVKHPRNALKDPTFLPIIDDVISNISIIHLRKRSIGEKTMVNTHPFAQGDLIFAHNGTIRTASPMKDLLPPDRRDMVLGTTDSEALFQWIVYNIYMKKDTLQGIKEAITSLKKTMMPRTTSLNFLMSDGQSLYAYCSYRMLPSHFTLHILRQKGSTIICSEPIGDAWEPIVNDRLIIIRKDLTSSEHKF